LSLDRSPSFACFILLSIAGIAVHSLAQSADNLAQVRKLYVEPLGHGEHADEVRKQVLHQLRRDSTIAVVEEASQADAVMKGTVQVWTAGLVSPNPHSHSREAFYQGFLSAEIVGRDNQTIWSYLVTPSRFAWNGISENLAHQLVSKLLADFKEKTSSEEAAAAPAPATAPVSLESAGGTFPAPLYQKWFESFQDSHPTVRIRYSAVGSGVGIQRVSEGQTDFGASDMPLSDEAQAQAHQRFAQIPTVLGAVVPIYNLPDLRRPIHFTPEILAGIYLGHIRKWNDSLIREANRGASLPDAEIVVVHRSDKSGTSFVWSDYLSKVSPEWKSSVGVGVAVPWPVGIGADYNEGVAAAVHQTPNSLGYVEFIYAIQHELSFAPVRNAAGEFVKADIESVSEAARNAGVPEQDLRISITNAPGNNSYPIATYTWLLLPEHVQDNNKRAALRELLEWMLTSGQRDCSGLGYAPLPAPVARRGLELADQALANSQTKASQ